MKNIQFTKFVTRPSTVARDQPFFNYLIKSGIFPCISIPLDKVSSEHYFEKESYLNYQKELLKKVLDNQEKHFSEFPVAKLKLIQAAKNIQNTIINKDEKNLLKYYEDYVNAAILIGDYMTLPYVLNDLVEDKIRKIFPEKFEIITTLSKPTTHHLFQKALLTETNEEIVKKFGWLNVYSPNDNKYTEGDIKELKRSINKEEVEKIFQSFEDNKIKFEEFIKTVQDEELRNLCVIMQEYAFLRTDRIDAWKEAMSYIKIFFEYLAEKISTKATIKEAVQISVQEIFEMLKTGTKPSFEELQKRANKEGLFYYDLTGFKLITNENEKEELLKSIKENYDDVKELVGRTAFRGHVTGVVKKILSDEDMKDFKEGEILVTRFTEPKHTIYMSKAKAIITDSGGITTHAAIVSRELEVPCVIGTEKATKVLNDGDIVEVDANNGIIKIIKQN